MGAGTPKKRFLGFYSQNDVVLDLFDTKRHCFGWQQYFFNSRAHPKMTSFGIVGVQNDVVLEMF